MIKAHRHGEAAIAAASPAAPTHRPLFRGANSIVADGAPFPSEHSARWWHRQHCAEAVRCGALIRLRGQWFADPDKLGRLVVKIGRREALATIGQ